MLTLHKTTQILAVVILIALIVMGFWLGRHYQQYLTQIESSQVLGLSINAMCSATPWYVLLAFAIIAIALVSAGATLIWGLIYFFLKRKSLNPKEYWLKFIKIVAIEILLAGIALIGINASVSQYS